MSDRPSIDRIEAARYLLETAPERLTEIEIAVLESVGLGSDAREAQRTAQLGIVESRERHQGHPRPGRG
jgi:hypothetical protein